MGKWEERKLSEVVEFSGGSQPPKSTFSNVEKEGFVRLIQIRDYKSENHVVYVEKSKTKKFCTIDDVMIGRYGPPVFQILRGLEGAYNVALMKAIPDEEVLNKDFLFKFLDNPSIQSYIVGLSQRSAGQSGVNKKALEDYPILIPPLDEQQRIVAKLDGLFADIDQAIGLLEENIAHTQALMGSVLDEEFGKLEATSKVVLISEIAEVKGGKRLPKGQKLQEFETDYPYVRVTDFSDDGSIKIENLRYISKEQHEQISRYIITNDDLYISIAGTIGKTGIIPEELNGANLTENAARLVYKDKSTIDNTFVYYYTKSDKFKRYVEDSTKQVAQPKLALTRLKEIKLALPSLKKQMDVVERIKAIEFRLSELTKTETQKLTHLKSLKSSLLDQAFKGEL